MRAWLAIPLAVVASVVSEAQPLFRAGVEMVQLDVAVMRGGRPVTKLTRDDFVLTDNGVVQTIEAVALSDPLDVTLLLDVSESVSGERLAQLIRAGTGLTHALNANDRVALVTFANDAELVVEATRDFEAARQELAALTGMGPTGLRDALYLGLQISVSSVGSSALTLVFSDGIDNTSFLTERQVLQAVRRHPVVVHAIRAGGRPSGMFRDSTDVLDRLTEASGGRTWSATSDRQLKELFTEALDEMRARYRLTYSPRGVEKPGWHEIKVRLKAGRADITARPGYLAPAPPTRN